MLAVLPGDGSLLARLSSHAQASCRHAPVWGHRHRRRQCLRASIDATNWDAEMSIFKQRIQKPNQLETLRNIEATMEIGKVPPSPPTPPHLARPDPTTRHQAAARHSASAGAAVRCRPASPSPSVSGTLSQPRPTNRCCLSAMAWQLWRVWKTTHQSAHCYRSSAAPRGEQPALNLMPPLRQR